MSYFHTGIRTIIGAEAFHCPVRDGKEWDHLAMVIRLNLLLGSRWDCQANSIESNYMIAHTEIFGITINSQPVCFDVDFTSKL